MILKGESPAQTGGSLTLRSHSSRQWRCTRSRHFQSSGALVSVPQVVFAPTLEICATLCLIQQHNTNHLLRSQLQLPSFDLPQRSYTHMSPSTPVLPSPCLLCFHLARRASRPGARWKNSGRPPPPEGKSGGKGGGRSEVPTAPARGGRGGRPNREDGVGCQLLQEICIVEI